MVYNQWDRKYQIQQACDMREWNTTPNFGGQGGEIWNHIQPQIFGGQGDYTNEKIKQHCPTELEIFFDAHAYIMHTPLYRVCW